jgi:hypothetical protein
MRKHPLADDTNDAANQNPGTDHKGGSAGAFTIAAIVGFNARKSASAFANNFERFSGHFTGITVSMRMFAVPAFGRAL